MRSFYALTLVSALVIAARGQFIPHAYNLISDPSAFHVQSNHLVAAPKLNNLAHPAVLENAALEAHLPDELKNEQYKHPHIAAGLAKESWFANKESPVGHRASEDIPRSEIYKIIQQAGFHH